VRLHYLPRLLAKSPGETVSREYALDGAMADHQTWYARTTM
jgi:hypothetical protein